MIRLLAIGLAALASAAFFLWPRAASKKDEAPMVVVAPIDPAPLRSSPRAPSTAEAIIFANAQRRIAERVAPHRVLAFAETHIRDAKRHIVCGKVSVASTNMRPLRFVSFGQQDMALIENGTVDFAATYLRICGA